MGELQDYYDEFRRGYWAVRDEAECLCHGSGWALSDVDTWHQCPIHFKGQRHPEDERDEEESAPWVPPVPEVELDVSEDEIPF